MTANPNKLNLNMAKLLAALFSTLLSMSVYAQEAWRYSGDVGLGVYRIDTIAGQNESSVMFPYLYGDWGPFYARVDTFGYKALPLGYGHLELSTRISFEGYRPTQAAWAKRSSPRLLGLGTFQETPVGGFFAYAFHDTVSGGAMLDTTYAAELDWGRLTLYPQLGLTRRSSAYVQHLYGVSPAQSDSAGVSPYQATASTVPNAGVAIEWSLSEHTKLAGEFKRRWLDHAQTASPMVFKKEQNSLLLAWVRTY
jgi:outer membrane protein